MSKLHRIYVIRISKNSPPQYRIETQDRITRPLKNADEVIDLIRAGETPKARALYKAYQARAAILAEDRRLYPTDRKLRTAAILDILPTFYAPFPNHAPTPKSGRWR